MTRKYPDFKSGEADAEAAQPEQVGRWKQILKLVVIDAVKNKNLKLFVYKAKLDFATFLGLPSQILAP